jgi:hypothetical protein
MCYRYLGDRTLGPLCSVPLGDEVLIALFLHLGRSLRRRRGMFINFGQTKSANFCVSRNGSVAVLADFRLAQHSCFETHERNVPLSSLTQSKPLQEHGLDDYPDQHQGKRQDCKFISWQNQNG